MVVFLIAGSQVSLVIDNRTLLWSALVVFALYLVAAAIVGKGLSGYSASHLLWAAL